VLDSPAPMVMVDPVPEVASIPATPPETLAPGKVVTVTVHALAASMPMAARRPWLSARRAASPAGFSWTEKP